MILHFGIMEAVKTTSVVGSFRETRNHEPVVSTVQETKKNISLIITKERKKEQAHKIRENLQKLFLGDNREITVYWEIFQVLCELLQHPMFEESLFAKILLDYHQSIDEWRKIYEKLIFLVKKDKDLAFETIKERKAHAELSTLGKNLEKMLDEITATLNEWERQKRLI